MRAVRVIGNVLFIGGGIFVAGAVWAYLVNGPPALSDGLLIAGICGGMIVGGYLLRRVAIRRAAAR